MNPLFVVAGAAVAVALVQRSRQSAPPTPARKRELASQWQKAGGRDCGGWSPDYEDPSAWAQCDPKTIPRAVQRKIGPQIARERSRARSA